MEKDKKVEEDRLVVIGGSAGSLTVLLTLFPLLKPEFNIPVIVVVHRAQGNEDTLAYILSDKTKLKVKEAEEKEPIKAGHVYIAPPDYHLLLERERTLSLDYSEKVNFSRPGIDVTFEAAAEVYHDRLICILLSGANADGAKGLVIAHRAGATTIVQKPATAEVSYMPEQAIRLMEPDYVLSAVEMAVYLNSLVR